MSIEKHNGETDKTDKSKPSATDIMAERGTRPPSERGARGAPKKAKPKPARGRHASAKGSPEIVSSPLSAEAAAPDILTAHAPEVDPASPPTTPGELHAWLDRVLDIRVPMLALLGSNSAPMDYLVHTFFEGRARVRAIQSVASSSGGSNDSARAQRERGGADDIEPPIDCVVWANRGGGKTFLGAVATMLDLVFKPGIEVRILGGSLEQSRRMHEHLCGLLQHDALRHLLSKRGITDKRVLLVNKSRAEILAQSQASVRGTRVQKVRCDEVELFDPEVWNAAQLATRSKAIAGPWGPMVRGGIEALSTMHRPMGLMWRLAMDARKADGSAGLGDLAPNASGSEGVQDDPETPVLQLQASEPMRRVLFRWGVVDALEHCPPTRSCERCGLRSECNGIAKTRPVREAGHIGIDDALRLKSRVSAGQWESEMLCLRPSTSDAVYPEFDPRVHVFDDRGVHGRGIALPGDVPLHSGTNESSAGHAITRTPGRSPAPHDDPLATVPVGIDGKPLREERATTATLVCGMDFGLRSPTVILWAMLHSRSGVLRVIDELVVSEETMPQHVKTIVDSRWGLPEWIGVDPAGSQRNDQTLVSNIQLLGQAGLSVRYKRTGVQQGVQRVRARLRPALHRLAIGEGSDSPDDHSPRLFIHARCEKLIESLSRYHYDEQNRHRMDPVKDGHDHAADALRYLIVNIDSPRGAVRTAYASS